ncbi:MAG TPA: hypothetical protein PKK06_07970 [Phycisphaerae bacterium]|nr:hypothetical protein [Phycisphaerae bacterium]HNU43755.1 hypothetical protein [Phycisphaerae bacterium]
MHRGRTVVLIGSALWVWVFAGAGLGMLPQTGVAEEITISGEPLGPDAYGPAVIESMEDVIERDRSAPPTGETKEAVARQGAWVVPSRRATGITCSPPHHLVNKWGDTSMGIGFPRPVNVRGAFFNAAADTGAATTGIRVVGYREGRRVGQTAWLDQVGAEPEWFALDLRGVDRIQIEAVPVYEGAGWYALDDLTFAYVDEDGRELGTAVVVNFDDLSYGAELTGSGYAGLTWETGKGDFPAGEGIHAPLAPEGYPTGAGEEGEPPAFFRDSGTAPTLINSFEGVVRGDAGQWSYPPDTDGAIGPNHYVITVNTNFAIFNRTTGAELSNVSLSSFLPNSSGDPRVLFDQHSQRWVVIVSSFNSGARIHLAVSRTSDPTGDWFKTYFVTAQGSDTGRWPDYPTLGVDQHGIYTAAYMVGGGMTIFAIDKAPLIASTPSLGTITAFRGLPWEGAMQPVHTYGTPEGEYVISRNTSLNGLRLRRINPPLTAPTLTELGNVTVPGFQDPPDAPALGASVALDTVDSRLMMSVYRGGSIWTCHTINYFQQAAVRWYEVSVSPQSLVQYGTVSHATRFYFFPSIMVNAAGHVALGFTGSSGSEYASCYFTGRKLSDAPGEMGAPVLYQAGTAAQNLIDSYGRNRFGDYSYTTLDPADDLTFWTLQEYTAANNVWGTYVGVLSHGSGDCNGNGIADPCDIDCGPTGWACDVPGCGQAADCNANGIPDECDIASGKSGDDNVNSIPDECEVTRYYVRAGATGTGHGTSWTNAFTSLKDALDTATQPYSQVAEIWVAEGTYTPAGAGGARTATFTLGSGVAVHGGFTGGETDVSQRDPVRHVTILSGDLNGDDGPNFTNISDNSHHVVTASGTDATALLDGFVIRGGNPAGATVVNGGGILNVAGHATLRNCRILNNSANLGSGMYNTTSAGPTLINCAFSGNSAAVGTLAVVNSSTLTLIHGTLAGNTAQVAGGIFLAGSTSVATATSCVLWGNTDNNGSGQSSQMYVSSGTVALNYSCVQGWTGSLGGTGNTGGDPLLVDLDGLDNLPGTLDDDLRLSAGSSGINTGDPTFVPDVEDRDLDGHARLLCGRVDMGACEFGIGDYSCDQTVDLADFAGLQNCFTGTTGGPYAAGCASLDFDYDGLVEGYDFVEFAPSFAGP